ncbi:nitrate- and nitrite sensing domain-containing protein [Dechloromonas agitata]|uniref:nitrate- and nitrite sensing domain-containing protein n=1 Tax=Dechloromonas agitata TaxID=73030 RepID=UPI00048585EB|nr:nitrate- and nitrite sensing domain-containing protein [Dechloromonas agitata]
MEWLMMSMPVLAALILALMIMHARQDRRRLASLSHRESLAACRALLVLIAGIQQHRGLSSAWLAGDSSFRTRLMALENDIAQRLPELQTAIRDEARQPSPCLTANELALFGHRWRSLCERLGDLTIEQSVAQHTMMIEMLLKWLQAFGEARIEPLVPEAGRPLVRDCLVRLPAITECLGQARALGMSIATRHGCPAVARVRLMFLVARAESLLKQVTDLGERSTTANAAIQHMARIIRTQMLQASGITISPQAFFSLSTAAIDAVFAWIGDSVDTLTHSTPQEPPRAAVYAH